MFQGKVVTALIYIVLLYLCFLCAWIGFIRTAGRMVTLNPLKITLVTTFNLLNTQNQPQKQARRKAVERFKLLFGQFLSIIFLAIFEILYLFAFIQIANILAKMLFFPGFHLLLSLISLRIWEPRLHELITKVWSLLPISLIGPSIYYLTSYQAKTIIRLFPSQIHNIIVTEC